MTSEKKHQHSETIGNDQQKEVSFTFPQIAKLFWMSFEHAQRDDVVQEHIFKYFHYLHPTWKISEELKTQLFEKMKKSFFEFLLPEKHPNQPHYHGYNALMKKG